jgi:hypothetical protein
LASHPTSRRFLLTSPCFFMAVSSCKEYHTIERRRPRGLRPRMKLMHGAYRKAPEQESL